MLQRVQVLILASNIPQQVKHSSVLVRQCNGAEVDPNTLAVFSGGQRVEVREKDAALQTAVHLAVRAAHHLGTAISASNYVIAVPVYHLRGGVAQESLRALVPGDNSLFSIGDERTIRCVP
jgi:hypothetical protein